MITETRQSRTRHLHYERHRRQHHHHRRHHTLDNATLDKFNFICVPLHRDEVNIHLYFLFSPGFLRLKNKINCCFFYLDNYIFFCSIHANFLLFSPN
jgi:hypothetical protein